MYSDHLSYIFVPKRQRDESFSSAKNFDQTFAIIYRIQLLRDDIRNFWRVIYSGLFGNKSIAVKKRMTKKYNRKTRFPV